MSKVVLGVSSSISLYKACEVLRGFQKDGQEVRVVMTRNAARLVSPLLFSSLSGQNAVVDLFEEQAVRSVEHVALAGEAGLFCVAPATANVIAKFASGIADDFLTTLYLAVRCPVLVAPAMNEAMYLHPQTQANMAKLIAQGVEFVDPEKGYLACGEEGWGRLADPEKIVEAGLRLLRKTGSLAGRRIIVTAGPTREPLDGVRFLSNPSTGRMGYEIAREASARGALVILVSGPSHLPVPAGVELERVRTAKEMETAVEAHFPEADAVIMAAAVSDFRFARAYSGKVPKQDLAGSVRLVKTPDILASLGRRKKNKILVGFAAETGDLPGRAAEKMKAKNVDLMVVNDVSRKGIGFESADNQVSLLRPGREAVTTARMSKREIGRIILDHLEEMLGQKG